MTGQKKGMGEEDGVGTGGGEGGIRSTEGDEGGFGYGVVAGGFGFGRVSGEAGRDDRDPVAEVSRAGRCRRRFSEVP